MKFQYIGRKIVIFLEKYLTFVDFFTSRIMYMRESVESCV